MMLKRASLEKSVVGRVGQFLAGGKNLRPLNWPPIIRIRLGCRGRNKIAVVHRCKVR